MQDQIIEGYRMSPQQEHLWLLQQFDGAPYLAQCAVGIEGKLDKQVLKEALSQVVQRHEVLRTGFRCLLAMSTPLQVITDASISWGPDYESRSLRPHEKKERIRSLLQDERQRPFDLEHGPLLNASLIICSPSDHVLLLTLPALCTDAIGLRNLVNELSRCYAACLRDEKLTDEPLQYVDQSEVLNDLLESEDTETGRAYWRNQDPFSLLNLKLPFERTASSENRFTPQEITLELAAEFSAQLKTLARKHQLSVSVFLLACWQVLLHRFTREPEITIATAFNGRTIEGVEEALGLFVKFLPVTLNFKENDTLIQIAKQLQEKTDEMRDWQDYYAPPPSNAPLPFAFEFHSLPSAMCAAELRFSLLHLSASADRSALKLTCLESADRILIELSYDEQRHPRAPMQRLAQSYRRLLRSGIAAPEHPIATLKIVDDNQEQQFREWNQTAVAYTHRGLLHELFEQQAAQTPDSVALVFNSQSLTYQQLNERANNLAHQLISLGVRPESLVALLMERSTEMVISLLAVLKAGAAYLPLDPTYPAQRLSFMLADARPLVLLKQSTQDALLDVPQGMVVIELDEHESVATPDVAEYESTNPEVAVSADNLAYLIYTSGSTGQPKGVMVSHRAITNRLLWMMQRFAFDSTERFLQKTSFSFDASLWELFVPLLTGARLVLARPGGQQESAYLAELLATEQITTVQFVPSMLGAMLGEEGFSNCPMLRRVFCGGEALSRELTERFFSQQAVAELHNLYGPTEAAIDATHWRCLRGEERTAEAGAEEGAGGVPIGRPIANMQMYVLDERLRPVPIGVSGELYIGGVGLARGYQGRAELTAERFIPHPFSTESGERLYRTGDVGRYLPGGEIEYVGRVDYQVKVRGYRIELGEIEAALREHKAVREAVVVAQEDERGHKRLVGYVVPMGERSLDTADTLLHQLPNGLEVAYINRNEAEVIYKEIFEDEVYLKHGIILNDNDIVFDIGANIGMFSLFVQQNCRHAHIYSFEPVPPVFKKLSANMALYGLDVKLFNHGISNEARAAKITFYPGWSGMSGIYADAADDEAMTRAFVKNQGPELAQYTDELLEGRFRTETFDCQLKTLSDVIREQHVERIDLLKVDVEKSELDVLEGIEDDDWKKIKQIVLEAHDVDGQLSKIIALLKEHGFDSKYEQDASQQHTGLYNIYAIHPSRADKTNGIEQTERRSRLLPVAARQALSNDALSAFLKEKLPEYMVPATYVVLSTLPRLSNSKIDRRALPDPDLIQTEESFQTPHTPVEELLVTIWSQLLGGKRVGVHNNFFELGGDSLLITQLVTQLRQVFGIHVPLRAVFDKPTVAMLAEVIETTSRAEQGLQEPPIERVSREIEIPLSFAQQRLWFVDQLQPGGHAYNIAVAVRIKGPLDAAALKQSFNQIVERHESMRTTFPSVDGRPSQLIADACEVELEIVDLSGAAHDEREAETLRLAMEAARRPFHLASGPLFHISLLRLEEQEHVLLLTMHHIISDGWSTGVFIREMALLYEAAISAKPALLPALPLQYADFAYWQRQWLQGEVLEAALSYWKQQLDGLPTLQLPTDRPRPATPSLRGAHRSLLLSRPLTEALKELGQREGVTLFMTLLAAFTLQLNHYSQQDDVVIGTDVANRNRAEVEGLIGFFVNQLVIRQDLSGNPTFAELLARVRAVTLGAYVNQDLPFDRLVKALKLNRDPSRAPLFQVKLVLQDSLIPALHVSELVFTPLEMELGVAQLDLTLFLYETEQGLSATLQYSTDLFVESTIARMLDHFERLLNGIVKHPEANLDVLKQILDDAEGEQRTMEQTKRQETQRKMFKNIKPRAISLTENNLIKTSEIRPGEKLPLVIQPATDEVDLIDWARNNQAFIQRELLSHGAILFRGFDHDWTAEFEQFASAICDDLFNENGEHPRESVSGHVYTPVFYPSEQQLLWHNENSFNLRWPMKIWFCCLIPAEQGGETPIVDSRKVFQALNPRLRERFIEKQVMYVRNYGNGLGLNWETVFRTNERSEVEELCRRTSMSYEWKPGNRLRTECVRPAAGQHPATGEMVWFNQAQHWHISCLDAATRESIQSVLREEDWPRSCYYGDGTPIEDSAMAEILGVYKELEVSEPWRRGDVLLLDNMLTAHARNAYKGVRKLLVTMGEMSSYDENLANHQGSHANAGI
jgi:amino acid adenylation domain-containing protein/FkbM family methyltransferase